MYVDFLTLACLHDHLDGLLGARVQQVILPDNRSVGLELYSGQRLYLVASASPQRPRILLAPEKLRRGVEMETPLLMLLRKWVRKARLVDVSQPPWERILMLHFQGQTGSCRLVVELVGRNSNVILVGSDGRVLEAVKHVGPDARRRRVILPAQPYQLPSPAPNRRPPTGPCVNEWVLQLTHYTDRDEPLHRWLVRHLLAVSPLAAREIAARAAGDAEASVDDAAPEAVAQATAEIFAPIKDGRWTPHVARDKDGAVIAFCPYTPYQFDEVEAVPDISQAMWRYFGQQQTMTDAYAAVRRAVGELIKKTEARLARQLEKLQEQQVDEDGIQALRQAGELLLTYQSQVQKGATETTLTDFEGAPRVIRLDSRLTPVENAQAYFRRYDKARRAGKHIPPLIRSNAADRAYVAQLAVDLALAESRPEMDAVHDALIAAGWAKKSRRKSVGWAGRPRSFEAQGLQIYVGRNARQNEQVTFKRAGSDDLWLHARGLPGAHVIVKSGGQAVPKEVVQYAAELAAYYSSARAGGGAVLVDVTERRFVRRLRGGHPGLVTYRNESTVWVDLDEVEVS